MATIDFKDKNTVIEADWLNEVDALVHDIFDASTTKAEGRTALDVPKKVGTTTDNGVTRYDGVAGQIQDSGVTIDDSDNMDVPGTLTVDGASTLTGNVSVGGTVDGRDISADGAELDTLVVDSSTDNAVVRFDGVSGALQNSGVTIDDSNNVSSTGSGSFGSLSASAKSTIAAVNSQSTPLTISDDAADSIEFGGDAQGVVVIGGSNTNGGCALVLFRAGTTPQCTIVTSSIASGSIVATTGALTGTTGTDGNVTISTHTDNKLYIENRTGVVKAYQFVFLATHTSDVVSL